MKTTRIETTGAADPKIMTIKPAYISWEPPNIKTFTIENFTTTNCKKKQIQLDTLLDKALTYMIYKNAVTDSLPNETGKTFQGFLEIMNTSESSPTEQTNVVYNDHDILDEYADNKHTILNALSVLQDKLKVGTKINFLVMRIYMII